MNNMQKGFTLFTALVGVLLVVLGVLLAQSMSSTERSTTEIIAENRLDQEMIDAAVLAQADSLQEFNFGLRSAMEKYFSHSDNDNYYELESEMWNATIQEIATDFQDKHFGTDLEQVAGFTADELFSTLPGVKRTQDFLIRIPEFDRESFKNKLKTAFETVDGTIVEVVDCLDKDNCPKGTFYINLDFTALSDENYEDLPRIEVIKKSTCKLTQGQNDVSDTVNLDDCTKKIRIPIVPRAKIRVLVPLRIFKAIAHAQKIAEEIFDTRTENRLEDVKLGVCDSKDIILRCCPPLGKCYETSSTWYSCAPRTRVEIEKSDLHNQTASMDKVCIGHEAAVEGKEKHQGNDLVYEPYITIEGHEYDNSSTKLAMKEYTFKEILVPKTIGNDTIGDLVDSDDFALRTFPFGNTQSIFFDTELHTKAFDSRNLGFDSDGDKVDDLSTCSKILRIEAGLVFEEKNPIYTLDSLGDDFSFQVKLVKNKFRGLDQTFDYTEGHSDLEEIISCPSNENAPSCTGYSYPPTCRYERDA